MIDLADIPPQDLEFFRSKGFSDEDIAKNVSPPIRPLQAPKGQAPGALTTLAEHAAVNVGPGAAFTIGAEPGAAAGAAWGAPLGLVGIGAGAFIGGLITGGVASWAVYKAQHAALEKMAPEFTVKMDEALAKGAEAHPFMAIAGQIVGNLPSMKAEIPKLSQLPFRAALGGSIGGVTPLLEGRSPNWQDIAGGAANAAVLGGSRFKKGPAPTVNEPTKTPTTEAALAENPIETEFTKRSPDGDYVLNNDVIKSMYKAQVKRPQPPLDAANNIEYHKADTTWKNTLRDPEAMRQVLSQRYIDALSATANKEPSPEPLKMAKEGDAGVVAPIDAEQTTTAGDLIGSPEAARQRTQDFHKAQEELAAQETVERLPLKDGEEGPKTLSPVETLPKTQLPLTELPVSKNTLNITKDKFLPSTIARPETKPIVEGNEPLAIEKPNAPVHDTRTEAELIQDRLEGTGAQYTRPKLEQSAAKPLPWEQTDQAPKIVTDHINNQKENPTTGSVLYRLAHATGHKYQPLAEWLWVNMDAKSRGVKWKSSPTIENSQYMSPHKGRGPSDQVTMRTDETLHAPTILEEAAHSMTSAKIPEGWRGLRGAELKAAMDSCLIDPKGSAHLKELVRCYYETAHAIGAYDALFVEKAYSASLNKAVEGIAGHARDAQSLGIMYDMGDLHEYIANAFKQRDFQLLLNSIKTTGNRTMWQRLINAVSHMLGVPIDKHGMLDRVLRNAAELIRQERGLDVKRGVEAIPHAAEAIPNDRIVRLEQQVEAAGLNRGGAEEAYKKVKGKIEEPVPVARERALEELRSIREEHASRGITPEEKEASVNANRSRPVNAEEGPTTAKDFGVFKKMFGSVLDNIRAMNHPGAKFLADAYQRALDYRQQLTGRYTNAIVAAGKGLTKTDIIQLNNAFETYVTKKQMPQGLSSKASSFFKKAVELYQQFGDEHIANKVPIMDKNGSMRLLYKMPWKLPTMANQKIEELFRANENVEAMGLARQEYLDYNTKVLGYAPNEAMTKFESFRKMIQGDLQGSGLSHQDYFNAIRKAAGDQLPPSWREQNMVKNMQRYFDRAGMAMAHYTKVESNHKAMAALGQTKDAWGNKIPQYKEGSVAGTTAVKEALGQFHTTPKDISQQTEEGSSALATGLFIASPGLEVHKLGSNLIKAVLYADNPYQAARSVGYAITHMKEGWNHSVEGGLIKLTAASAHDMFDNSLSIQQRMGGVAKLVRGVSTLAGLTTEANAAFQQIYFEHLLPTIVARANSGNKTAQMKLRHWDPDFRTGKTYTRPEIQQLASTTGAYVHGTGDIRQMPAWMLSDGELSGFAQLAHWSIAQTNNFMHDVWMPAKHGNLMPLCSGLFGSAVAGYVIKEIREEIQGKKGAIPSLEEIESSRGGLMGNKSLIMYNAIAGMQYAGFGGLFSQVAKYPFDAAYKNNPQGATFPLDEIATDVLATANKVATAMINDPNINYVDLAATVAQHVLGSNIKLASIAINQGINNGMITGLPAEKKKLSDKMGELRRFDMVTGIPYNELDVGTNPFMNIEQRRFRMEQDPRAAVQMLPTLISNIMKAYGDHPDVMMQKIEALKNNSYATFPSMEKTPLSFYEYITYLKKKDGPEKAQAALMDYMRHKAINQVKSSVVP